MIKRCSNLQRLVQCAMPRYAVTNIMCAAIAIIFIPGQILRLLVIARGAITIIVQSKTKR